jgi:hypothetical protein
MTFEELLADARATLAPYPQYVRVLREENCTARVARVRRSARGRAWFEKGENVLVVGPAKWRTDLRPGEPQFFVTIWSRSAKCMCLTPETSFR